MRLGRAGTRGLRILGLVLLAVPVAAIFHGKTLRVEYHLARAHRALGVRRNEPALGELRAALRLAPDRPETLFLLARAHRRLGNFDRVPVFLRYAERLGGDPQRARRETWMLWANLGRMREAEPHLQTLLQDPRDDGIDICDAYVQGYLTNYATAPALWILDGWLEDYPDDPQPYYLKAYVLQNTGRAPEAIGVYRQGLAVAPDHFVMRRQYALALMAIGDLDSAEAEFRRCLEQAGDDPAVLTDLADCLWKRDDSLAARTQLRKALDSAPEFYDAHRLMGEIAWKEGRSADAVAHLEPIAKLRPRDTSARFMLGQALQAVGRSAEAKECLDYVGRTEEPLKRLERQARQVLQRPDDLELRYQVGLGMLEHGDPKDGVKWLMTVLDRAPNHAGARRALAAYYESRGDLPRAMELRRPVDAAAAKPSEQRPPVPQGRPLPPAPTAKGA